MYIVLYTYYTSYIYIIIIIIIIHILKTCSEYTSLGKLSHFVKWWQTSFNAYIRIGHTFGQRYTMKKYWPSKGTNSYLVGGGFNPLEEYAPQIGSFPQLSAVKIPKNIWVATTWNTYDFTISISQCLPLFTGKWGNQKDNKSVLSVLLIDPSRWIPSRWGEIHFQWKFLHGPFQLIRPTSCDRKIWCTGLTSQVE